MELQLVILFFIKLLKRLAPSIHNPILPDAVSMDFVVVAGFGNGSGFMELDSANLSFIQKIVKFKNKDGLV